MYFLFLNKELFFIITLIKIIFLVIFLNNRNQSDIPQYWNQLPF